MSTVFTLTQALTDLSVNLVNGVGAITTTGISGFFGSINTGLTNIIDVLNNSFAAG
jgi:hypothetical protein